MTDMISISFVFCQLLVKMVLLCFLLVSIIQFFTTPRFYNRRRKITFIENKNRSFMHLRCIWVSVGLDRFVGFYIVTLLLNEGELLCLFDATRIRRWWRYIEKLTESCDQYRSGVIFIFFCLIIITFD